MELDVIEVAAQRRHDVRQFPLGGVLQLDIERVRDPTHNFCQSAAQVGFLLPRCHVDDSSGALRSEVVFAGHYARFRTRNRCSLTWILRPRRFRLPRNVLYLSFRSSTWPTLIRKRRNWSIVANPSSLNDMST